MQRCLLRLVFCGLVLSLLSAQRPRLVRAQAGVDAGGARKLQPRSPAPPRPPPDTAQEAGRRLFEAIVHDDPHRAAAAFFPRAAFVQVKAMQQPERYYDKLYARFAQDIQRLHRDTPELAQAEFVELALGHRGGWVAPGEEGNRLPYWAARHTTLRYRVGSELRTLEVRVLITWEQRWYIIHLREFH